MIQITPTIAIDEKDIKWSFIRSSGPGGQHVNKTATAVQLRFPVASNPYLPPDVRNRLIQKAKHRMTADGDLFIDARRFRSQKRNRDDALKRLVALIKHAARKPTPRKKTAPSLNTRLQRLENKRRRSRLKKQRQAVTNYDD